ncbi:MAG: MFS transporter [Muribaculaceae bacterium]
MKQIPNKSFWSLWNISFGFFGVQIAYALQSANISSIFTALGADPHKLSFFWILPPLMGMIVQPIIGTLSDKTWTRFGRRIPYLFVGAVVAVAVMCLLPNAGSLGLTTQIIIWGLSGTMLFGLFSLMLLDTSINIAMQPFKMMVGDMVNEQQKAKAYSIQSFLCNAGSLVGFLFPYILTYIGVKNNAPTGMVSDSVIFSFYAGSAILILCVIYTTLKVKEYPPEEYAEYHGIEKTEAKTQKNENFIQLLAKAPSAFWTVGLVQFFCWAAFLYMWTYTHGAITDNVTWTITGEDTASDIAKNWVGVLFAVQAVGSVFWAVVIPRFKSLKSAYIISLLLGAAGFISTLFIHNQYVLFIPFLLVGCAWAAMLALPFTLLTNALTGGNMGAYLGLFNCTICLPQIVAAVCGSFILHLVGSSQAMMLVVAGILLIAGSVFVLFVKTKK